ncbi:MAG TPA: methyltransferase [Steroidobacteraceae bacterium]|nr:methyltransferase [Steroidobacteraceae bacterium]
MRGVLCDRISTRGAAGTPLDDPEFAGRFTIGAGDFFDTVPRGGDYYILSSILHDWSDAQALAILRNCRRAMSPGAKLLVTERVIDPRAEGSDTRLSDMFILALLGGRERTASEFTVLLAKAGFAVTRVVPTKSPFSIVEGSYVLSSGGSLDGQAN